MEEKPKLPILLFDQECPLCVRFKETLIRTEGFENLNPIAYQNDEVYIAYPSLSKENCAAEIHLLLEDESILKGSDALAYLLKLNPSISKFSWLIESNMGKKAIDYFHQMTDYYRQVARKRCSSCQ